MDSQTFSDKPFEAHVVVMAETKKLTTVTPSVIRRGLCMVRQEGKYLKERKAQLIQSKKGLVECASKVAQTAIKYGVEVAKSRDPLAAAIALGGRSGVGVSLSHFSASQCAGIVGIIVTSITPQVSVPLLLKKVSEDLEYLKKSLNIVRENPQYMANEFLSAALHNLDNFDEAFKYFEKANYEAMRGIHMAPTFQGSLGCVQIRLFSSVMIECASSLNGIPCFLPLNCLSEHVQKSNEMIIVGGLQTIMKKAKTKKWNGKLHITMKTQDIIDPYLAALYNTYSLSAGLTDPYQDSTLPPPTKVNFTIDTTYIPEGEYDSCNLELILHDDISVELFIWKEFNGTEVRVFLMYKMTAWNFDASRGSRFDVEYDVLQNSMKKGSFEMEKIVGWPSERKSTAELLCEAKLKIDGKLKKLCRSPYKWINRVPEQYLNCMDLDLDEVDTDGSSILHKLAELNEYKNMECVLDKIKNLDPLDKQGFTPLHKACVFSAFQAGRLLIQNGANVNLVTDYGDSPLMLLAKIKNPDLSLIKLILEFNAIRRMAKAKADIQKILQPV